MNSEHVMIWVMREVHANIDFSWCCRFTDKPIFPSCCVRQNFQARSFWVARGWDGRSSSTCFTAWTSEATTTPLPSTHIIMNRVKMSTCRYPTSFYNFKSSLGVRWVKNLINSSVHRLYLASDLSANGHPSVISSLWNIGTQPFFSHQNVVEGNSVFHHSSLACLYSHALAYFLPNRMNHKWCIILIHYGWENSVSYKHRRVSRDWWGGKEML